MNMFKPKTSLSNKRMSAMTAAAAASTLKRSSSMGSCSSQLAVGAADWSTPVMRNPRHISLSNKHTCVHSIGVAGESSRTTGYCCCGFEVMGEVVLVGSVVVAF